MKVKLFNGLNEYCGDMDFETLKKSGFDYAGRDEMMIFNTMKRIINECRKENIIDEDIIKRLKKIYNETAWNTYMYEDRFEYLMNNAFNKY